jgi:predicted outer membrane protein
MRAILISGLLLAPLLARAAGEPYAKDKKAEGKPELSQTQLLDKLHHVNVTHIEMGNLAQTHAKSDKVKDYGARMTKDFEKLDRDVISYAKTHDIVLSEGGAMPKEKGEKSAEGKTLDENRMAKMERLGKMQGEEFDKAFLTTTIEGSTRMVPMLEAAKGKYDDKKFDDLLQRTDDTLTKLQHDGEKLQQTYESAT